MTLRIEREADEAAWPELFLPFHVISNWLNKEEANRLLAYSIENEARFRAGRIFYKGVLKVDSAYKNARVLHDLGDFEALLRAAAVAAKPSLEQLLGISPFSVKTIEVKLAAYGDGTYFRRHIDTLVAGNESASNRVLTLVLYLNREPKAFSGGALRMYALGSSKTKDVEPMHTSWWHSLPLPPIRWKASHARAATLRATVLPSTCSCMPESPRRNLLAAVASPLSPALPSRERELVRSTPTAFRP